MSVYIDNYEEPFRGMVMCHMIADTVDELHEMARLLRLKRSWFQPKSFPHYDVSLTKKAEAIRLGAIAVDTREIARLIRLLRPTL